MPRQSISISEPNSEWLRSKVESEKEYASNSEVVNDLIRRARENETEIKYIRQKLIEGEQSGFSQVDKGEFLAEIKDRARRDGLL